MDEICKKTFFSIYLNRIFMDLYRYVKRALPTDDEHPRERFETTRDLMIVIDFDTENCDKEEFLKELRAYFSSYGQLYACKYCHETNFDYILVEFADKGKRKCFIQNQIFRFRSS
jgi:hypothetical protein